VSDWGEPAYVRVLNDLRRKIESGEIPPGEKIPSVAELARDHRVAATTVQKAVRALKAAGLVESEIGKGTYVREVARLISRSAEYVSPVKGGGKAPHGKSEAPEVDEVVPPDDVAEKLGIEPGAKALRRSRLMVDDDGTPLEIATSYIPLEIARGTALTRSAKLKGATPTVLRDLGYPPRTCQEWVEGRMPTSGEARALRLSAGVPVLRVLRQTCADGQRPIEALEIVFSAARYMLEYDLPVQGA
jgi:GntR family transcriptional regulator